MSKQLDFKEKLLKRIKRDKKATPKHVFIALVVTFLFIAGFEMFYTQPVPEAESKEDSAFSASFVGDMMFGRHVLEVTENEGTDFLFENVAPYFQNSDYVTGNFENAVTLQEEENYQKLEKSIHLSSDASPVQSLARMNFTNVNLANNHTMDFGEQGMIETMASLDEAGLPYVGAGQNIEEAQEIDYQEIKGLNVATLGFSDVPVSGSEALQFRAGVADADPEQFLPLVQEASENADMVFVHIHWGAEYDNEPHPRQRKLAEAIVDAGADVIIGHHPHVLSPVEVYKDSVIFYSLGNFIFDQGWSRTRDSALVNYNLMNDGTGRFEILPMRIREARPALTTNLYNQKKIFLQLTRGEPEENFTEENGRLTIEVDHSSILEQKNSRR
ncbi:capsular biosynthesis protein [Halobacillus halophilus]|uniref:CapA family protein n=1 Tax=Halobacillus halophilus TaxID=1570 RepID=UPI0013687E72|nr:CapA family protein [Halobacillus halophilus]MYL30854.1 capsular biosynthesis protein [Halobacillus halophilus]